MGDVGVGGIWLWSSEPLDWLELVDFVLDLPFSPND